MKKRSKHQSFGHSWLRKHGNLILLFGIGLLLSCESRTLNPAPAIVLPEDKMEEVLYDLSLLNALHASRFPKQGEEIFNQDYLFKKHGLVDSVWVQNQRYYAQNPRRLHAIYRRINGRIKHALDSLDLLIAQEKEEKAKKEQEEKAKKEQEEKAKKEQEEKAKKDEDSTVA